jgi:hypothetical protein
MAQRDNRHLGMHFQESRACGPLSGAVETPAGARPSKWYLFISLFIYLLTAAQ